MIAALLLVVAVAGDAAIERNGVLPEVITWAQFKVVFGRNFSASSSLSLDLELARQKNFDDSIAFIRQHNAEADAGRHSFRCGVNQYADLSHGEFRALLGRRPAVGPPPPVVAQELAHVRDAAIPTAVDWRTHNAVSAVKNQGQCGGCWAFSVTGAIEGAYAIATGALRSLSEQQLIDCDSQNQGCHGGNQANGFSYVQSNSGIDTEKDYAYDGSDDPCWSAAAKRDAASIDSSSSVPPLNESALAAAVATVPVAASVQVTTSFRHYKSGVFEEAGCGSSAASLDHAILIIGFTKEAWLVKNSCALHVWSSAVYAYACCPSQADTAC
jgi:C1A family cysteine protease